MTASNGTLSKPNTKVTMFTFGKKVAVAIASAWFNESSNQTTHTRSLTSRRLKKPKDDLGAAIQKAAKALREAGNPRGPIIRWHVACSGGVGAIDRSFVERGKDFGSIVWFAILQGAGYSVEDQRNALYNHKLPW